MPKPPILALLRCLKDVPFCGGRSIESMLSWPCVPSACAGRGDGKLPSASMNGGRSSLGEPVPELELGEIDRIPTMMIGTIRPSLSPGCPLAPTIGSAGSDAPNRNIRKKLRGAPGVPDSPSPSPLPCRNADAIRPFCRARRKPSKLPSSPLPPRSPKPVLPVKLLASRNALWSSPMSVAAVAAAATLSSLLSIAA